MLPSLQNSLLAWRIFHELVLDWLEQGLVYDGFGMSL